MQNHFQRLPAWIAAPAALLLCLTCLAARADDDSTDASAHVLAAEIALHAKQYLEASREYRLAAEQSSSVEIAQQATVVATTFGFHEDGLAAARRWQELAPESDEALFYVARLQLRTGDLRRAKRSYRRLLEDGDEEPDRRLLTLISVLSEEDAEDADEIMRSLARPYRESAYAHYAAAVMALQAEDTEHAEERVLRALDLEAEDWLVEKAKLLYGRILLISGEVDEAIDYVARIIGDSPQPDPGARLELALIMMSAGRDDDALSQVNQVLLENASQTDALRLMAIINFRQNNLDAAWQDFQDLLASGQHTMDALYYLARIADFRDQPTRAIRLYSQVKLGSHALTAQRRAAALIAFDEDSPDEALERLDEFAVENPRYAIDMVQARAQLLVALERYPDALQQYDYLIRYRPENEGVSLGRAELLLRMERLDEAIAQYRDAVKRWPESAMSLNALGYTLADRTERYREAERLIRKALRYDPESPAIIDSLGWVLFKLGRPDEALIELERAYEGLEDPEVAAHIVEVLAVLDRREDALAFLVAAEEKDPESPLLKDVRERVFPETP